jgi:Fe-S-cluster-containing hydrogenase component 2
VNKYISVDFSICIPSECDSKGGTCRASEECTKNLLEQEEPYEAPVLLSSKMCVGCSDCVRACPLGAIKIESGY